MTQFKLAPRSQADWLQNYRDVQARLQQAGGEPEYPEEPGEAAPVDQTLELTDDSTPREAAG